AAIDVRPRGVVVAPVGVFAGRVDLLGDALAGEAADDGAHGSADGGADRTGDGADRRARGDPAGDGADAGADRVGARGAGERIEVGAAGARTVARFVGHGCLRSRNESAALVSAALPDQRARPRRNRLTMPSRITAPTSETSIAGRLKLS